MSLDTSKPEWRTIPGFSRYTINQFGVVKKWDKILKPYIHKSRAANYLRIGLIKDSGERKQMRIHRLVAMAFIENPFKRKEVNHKDGNTLNNSVQNLEWATSKQNHAHYTNHLRGKI